MTQQEMIAELLTRLGIFPKPKPKTLDAAVKVIERQRWELVKIENEACDKAASEALSRALGEYAGDPSAGAAEQAAIAVAMADVHAAIRARVGR